jgi:predicted GH43/DUF377 family glycosyl hydrolase
MDIKYAGNPVVRPADVPPSMPGYRVMGAFNPGAVKFGDEILLFVRVAERAEPREGFIRMPFYRFEGGIGAPDVLEIDAADPEAVLRDTRGVSYRGREYLSSMSHIRLARSNDGRNFRVEDRPLIAPASEAEEYGVEDARVTQIEGRYCISYTAVSRDSWATALGFTDDFRSIERAGIIFHPENKDVAIFPEKIRGKYAALHRPNNSGFGRASIWYAESPDMLHWGNHQCIVRPRSGPWESMKIGAGAPPIKTREGWLVIYHGKGDNSLYSLFCLLLDLEDPRRIVRRAEEPLLQPSEPYEVEGFFPNVVFSNGVVEKDGKLYIYYGAADETTCLAIAELGSLLRSF